MVHPWFRPRSWTVINRRGWVYLLSFMVYPLPTPLSRTLRHIEAVLIRRIEIRVVRIPGSPGHYRSRRERIQSRFSHTVGNKCVPWQPGHLLLRTDFIVRIDQSGLLRLVLLGWFLLRCFCRLLGSLRRTAIDRRSSWCWCCICIERSRGRRNRMAHVHLLQLVGIDLRSTKTGSLWETRCSR